MQLKPYNSSDATRKRHSISLLFFFSFFFVGIPIESAFILRRVTTRLQDYPSALMGIKGFRSWLDTAFPESVVAVPKGSSEQFDHVLVDINQFLHQVVRKSKSQEHALTLLMKELDECLRLASPSKTLVLAMDGPPAAAKIATQRRRRFTLLAKSGNKIKKLDKLLESPNITKRINPRAIALKRRMAAADNRTLCITPGTDFMHMAEQALMYWVWQRFSARNSTLTTNAVDVFISPSTVPGEGEVKLLEWIYKGKIVHGDSIAILGGDSDLVLEGLTISTSITHNVFILLPEGRKKHLCVSIWEITRTLGQMMPDVHTQNVMKMRIDIVILLILNGNDYLPKLRGSNGFNKLLHTYIRLQKSWNKQGLADSAYLVNPESLKFNLDFCLDFFSRLAAMAPANVGIKHANRDIMENTQSSALNTLYNFVNAGYLPSPCRFECRDIDIEETAMLENDEDGEYEEPFPTDDNDGLGNSLTADSEDDADLMDDSIRVQLMLGDSRSDDFYTYDCRIRKGTPMKTAKQRLAKMALNHLLADGFEEYDDLEDEGDDDDDDDERTHGTPLAGYEWEATVPAEPETNEYVYGLLWTVQTYRDGICPDYGYNYGKRRSPTAKDICELFKQAKENNEAVGMLELGHAGFTPPMPAALCCLASLPAAAKQLIPPPYQWISDETVENIYASCMEKTTNVFSIHKFTRMVEDIVPDLPAINDSKGGRNNFQGDHYWTAMSKVQKPLARPVTPPSPFSSRLSSLRPNRFIKVANVKATIRPPPKVIDRDKVKGMPSIEQHLPLKLSEVDYKAAFPKPRKTREVSSIHAKKESREDFRPNKQLERGKLKLPLLVKSLNDAKQRTRLAASTDDLPFSTDVLKTEVPLYIELTSYLQQTTSDGLTALACLMQLSDAGLLSQPRWQITSLSKTDETIHLAVEDLNHDRRKLSFARSRTSSVSRQFLKQHLASLVIQDVAGCDWTELSFHNIKGRLVNGKESGD